MTDNQFFTVWSAALPDTDRDIFVSDWATSSLFLADPDNPPADLDPALINELGTIWDVAHMSFKALRAATGLSQVAFAERYCIPRRTVENWDGGSCPSYVRLMLAQLLGIIKR